MQAGMHIPQELLKELPKKKKQQPNGIEACSLKSAIKKSHIVLKYNQKTGQIRPVVKSKSTTAKSLTAHLSQGGADAKPGPPPAPLAVHQAGSHCSRVPHPPALGELHHPLLCDNVSHQIPRPNAGLGALARVLLGVLGQQC
jgi:uncharacterized protein YwbE